MKTNTAFKIAAVLFFAVTPLPFAVFHAADERPPADNADHPKLGALIDDKKLRRLAWGPPATNGLQASCYFEPTKEAYADGEIVIRSRTVDEELKRVSALLLKRGPQRFPGDYRLDEYYQELKARKRVKDEHELTPK